MVDKHKIELTSKQIIDFIGEDFCKFFGTFETYKKANNKLISNGAGLLEGYFLISKHQSQNCLYLKRWKEEKDIPYTNALFDNSTKVKDMIFQDNECIFYLSYLSIQGIIELTIDKNDKENSDYPKIIYYLKLIGATDV